METTERTDFRNRPVGEVVAEDYRRATAFKRFAIDFCCAGGRTVQDACDRKGVAYEEVEEALLATARSNAAGSDPRDWSLDLLADHIVTAHHAFVRENLPALGAFTTKVAHVHGEARPELVKIARLVEELGAEMGPHMAKEEQVLFPFIRALVAAKEEGDAGLGAAATTSVQAIRVMEAEHDRAGEIMRQIRELSTDYTPPDWACNTYRAVYVLLEQFEDDLHRHVHLENNVLFPATEALAQELAGAA